MRTLALASPGGSVPEQASRATTWGADEALTHLYAAHWHALVRLAWLLLHNQQAAEEAAQDAFVSMHAKWAQLRDPDLALAYLRRSVVNASRSVLRHRGVEERWLRRETGLARAGAAPSAEQQAMAHQSGARLLQALARLPRRQREVLTLRYYLDLSEAEIADSLGISAGSVKSHASRGLAALRAEVEEL
ncbi:MAG TPA: SigE family RNA polymerase sigma factor [Dermatophilaceae bacterium]|nr:SigE family RNA polymerase sigma factor [Dermatophilaceae bacterium]